MTVNELLQKLVELARDGKGQWEVTVDDDDFEHRWTRPIDILEVREDETEIVIA